MGTLNGYLCLYLPNHPRAFKNGMVYEHVLVAEKKMGRQLKKQESIHHVDHNRKNNDPSNLVVFATKNDHTSFHNNGEDNNRICFDQEGVAHYKKDINICTNCGKVIGSKAKMCISCTYISRRVVERPSKNTLKELIKIESFSSIGKRYNVTDNTIRKWCKSYGLPYRRRDIVLENQCDNR